MTRLLRRARGVVPALIVSLLMIAVPIAAPPAAAAPGPASAPMWWFDHWNVPALRAQGATGAGITIAVVDTGIQASIPELAGKVISGADFTGRGGDGRVDYDRENFGHGTAMASLLPR